MNLSYYLFTTTLFGLYYLYKYNNENFYKKKILLVDQDFFEFNFNKEFKEITSLILDAEIIDFYIKNNNSEEVSCHCVLKNENIIIYLASYWNDKNKQVNKLRIGLNNNSMEIHDIFYEDYDFLLKNKCFLNTIVSLCNKKSIDIKESKEKYFSKLFAKIMSNTSDIKKTDSIKLDLFCKEAIQVNKTNELLKSL